MAYREMWEIEIRHEGLNKYRHIRGSDKYAVGQKAVAQQLAWDEMWERKKLLSRKKKIGNPQLEIKKRKKNLRL